MPLRSPLVPPRLGIGALGAAASVAALQLLNVAGNKIVDARGKAVILRGFSHSSAETRPVQTATFYETATPNMMTAAARLGANLLRLPLSQAAWLGTVSNAGISGAPYRAAITALVTSARAVGLFVALDLHWNDPQPTAGFTPAAAVQQLMANRDATGSGTTDSRAFWSSVANTFKGDTGVIFDLYNEPHDITWAQWLSGGAAQTTYSVDGGTGTVTYSWTTAGMQELLDAVRATGAKNICIANGIGYANALGEFEYATNGNQSLGWLSHKPTDATGQLIAGCHLYPDQPYTRTTAGTRSFVASAAATVLTVAASVPVFVGEYGDKRQTPTDNFIPLILPWMERNGLSHAAWTFNAWSDTNNVLLSTYSDAVNPYDPKPDTGGGAIVLPYIRARRRPLVAQMNISAGQPIYASSGSGVTSITGSLWDGTNSWQSSGYPAAVSLDLSTVPATNRTDIAMVLSTANYIGDSSVNAGGTYRAFAAYTIQGNAGAGGGAVPSSGWVDLLSVSGNTRRSRSHRLLLAASRGGTPYNWLRINFTAGDPNNVTGQLDASLADLVVLDASAGNYSGFLLLGDSILTQEVRADNTGFGAYFKTRYPAYPAMFELLGAPGYKAADFAGGGSFNTQFLGYIAQTACQSAYIAFGTNDASPGVAGAFDTEMRYMVDQCLAAGIHPIVPTIPWSTDSTRNTNVGPLNAKIAQMYVDYGGALGVGPDWYTFFQSGVLTTDVIHPVDNYPKCADELARVLGLRNFPGASADNWTPPTTDLTY